MPPLSGFSSGFYDGRSRRFDAQRLENLLVEAQESGTAQSPAALLGTPGLRRRTTLPTLPLRGLWAGDNRLFAVAGSVLYEVFFRAGAVNTDGTDVTWVSGPLFTSEMVGQTLTIGDLDYQVLTFTDSKHIIINVGAGTQSGVAYNGTMTYTSLGDVGDNDSHSQVQVFANGLELFIVSADQGYIATGVSVVKAQFLNGEGTVTVATVSTTSTVTWISGNQFDTSLVGNPFLINGIPYTVKSLTDATHLVLVENAGNITAPSYSAVVAQTGMATAAGTTVTWVSGAVFTAAMAGQPITLGTQTYTIDSFTDSHHIELTTNVITEEIPVKYRIQLGGTVDVSGTAVTLASGDDFDDLLVGVAINIGGADYTVASVTDSTHLVLTAPAGDQTGATYSATLPERNSIVTIAGTTVTWISGDLLPAALAGTSFPAGDQVYNVVSVAGDGLSATLDAVLQQRFSIPLVTRTGTVTTSDTAVTRVSGDNFDDLLVGMTITIGTTDYVVESVTDASALVLTESAGTQTAPPYQATAPLRARMGAFADAKFIAFLADTNDVRFSPLNNGLKPWDPIDAGDKEGAPDRLLAMMADHEELWLWGYETAEVWRNTISGAAAGWERDPGATIQQGISAPRSAVSLDNGVAWLGEDSRGRGVAWLARGYQPIRISSHAVEEQWRRYGTIQDAEAYSYQEGGHAFWVIHFPSGNATWVYDATANSWAERTARVPNGKGKLNTAGTAGTWVSGDHFAQSMVGQLFTIDGLDNWVASVTDSTHLVLKLDAGTQTASDFTAWVPGRQRQRCHAFAFQRHLVGDYANGNIYEQSIDFWDDDDAPILRERTCPHVSKEQFNIFYHRLQLEMEVGVGGNSYTDLVIDSAAAKVVTSVLHPFTNRDIGRYLNVTGGTGFTVQRVRIVAVNGQNVATMSKSMGTLSSTGGVATTDDPQMWLELSRNGGKTYGPIHAKGAGLSGEDIRRVNYNRLGYARDRVFRIRSTARMPHTWMAANLLATEGTG